MFAQEQEKKEEKRVKLEFEIDPYYASVGLYASLTRKPIPYLNEKNEWEIYKTLFKKSFLPRFMVMETSINPAPYFGTIVKQEAQNFYQSMKVTKNLNLVQAVTAGFEEPWAYSLFLGDVVDFTTKNQMGESKGKGYLGTLISMGNFHIKDNLLVHDEWLEMEGKMKGDNFTTDRTMKWSFRGGLKFHRNVDIADTLYLSFRRSRIDFKRRGGGYFFIENSGFEYTFHIAQKDFSAVRHYFAIDKKVPVPKYKLALTMAIGFVWSSDRKYSGSLKTITDSDPLQILLRPNIEF